MAASQVVEGPNEAKIQLEISIQNWEDVSVAPTAGKNHFSYLLVGDEDDNILFVQKIKDEDMLGGQPFLKTFDIKKKGSNEPKGTDFQVSLLSESWIGIDLPRFRFTIKSFPYFKRTIKEVLTPFGFIPTGYKSEGPSTSTETAQEAGSGENEDFFPEDGFLGTKVNDPSSCKHTCKNKSQCKHECCKSGPKSSRKRKATPTPTLQKSNVVKQLNVSFEKSFEE